MTLIDIVGLVHIVSSLVCIRTWSVFDLSVFPTPSAVTLKYLNSGFAGFWMYGVLQLWVIYIFLITWMSWTLSCVGVWQRCLLKTMCHEWIGGGAEHYYWHCDYRVACCIFEHVQLDLHIFREGDVRAFILLFKLCFSPNNQASFMLDSIYLHDKPICFPCLSLACNTGLQLEKLSVEKSVHCSNYVLSVR